MGVTLVEYTDARAESNYSTVADIIHHDIMSSSSFEIPVELTHLLYLMRNKSLTMAYVIVNHSSLVPMENRSFMYLSHFQYVYGPMFRSPDTEALQSILDNLIFDADWFTKIPARNQYLAGYLQVRTCFHVAFTL
jgi:hypothetical protein